jgi:hypothetical protein
MLAGTRPYNGASPAEQLALQREPPAAIEGPEALTTLVASALDPIPDRRPTAVQVGRSLTAWLDGRADTETSTTVVPVAAPVVAAPTAVPASVPAAAHPLASVSRRAPARVVAVAAVLIVAVALGSLALYGLASAPGLGDGATFVPDAVVPATNEATAPPAVPAEQAGVDANRPTVNRSGGNRPDRQRAGDRDDEGKGEGKGKGKKKNHDKDNDRKERGDD